MSFFDNLVKGIVRGAVRAETNKIERKVTDKVTNEIKEVKKEESKYSVPEAYQHFPQFEGVIEELSTKKVDNYERCTIDYRTDSNLIEEYTKKVLAAGYDKKTSVRYEKNNEYIIIEPDGNSLHLVFHIKY